MLQTTLFKKKKLSKIVCLKNNKIAKNKKVNKKFKSLKKKKLMQSLIKL
jgi:hypothetical protein